MTTTDNEVREPVIPGDMDGTRESFLVRLREMDPNGWEELYRRYQDMILTRARRAGLNEADAKDVVQVVFTSVARNPPQPSEHPGAFRAWMREQTRWRITDRLREAGRRPGVPSPLPDPSGEPGPGPLDTLEARDEFAQQWDTEFARHVHELAVARLLKDTSAEHYQIYQLTEEQDWPVGRVARHFNLAAATVYVIRHRVGSRLKAQISRILGEIEDAGHANPSPPPR